MRVIKYGDTNRLRGIRRFTCEACGCEFEADKTEYKHDFDQREDCGWYSIRCPTCNQWVTQDEKEA